MGDFLFQIIEVQVIIANGREVAVYEEREDRSFVHFTFYENSVVRSDFAADVFANDQAQSDSLS